MPTIFDTLTLGATFVLSVASCVTAIAAWRSALNVRKSLDLQERRDEEQKRRDEEQKQQEMMNYQVYKTVSQALEEMLG